MKSFIKTLVLGLSAASLAFAGIAFAASFNDDPQDFYVFEATNKSGTNGAANNWSRNVTIGDNDLLSFALYYHATSGTIEDVTFTMEDLRGRTFSAGSSETVNGRVSTSNAGSSAGTSSVRFNDDVTLRLYNVSWQPNQCTSVTCERPFPGSATNVLGSGINIGDIAEGWATQGNMVVTFKAIPVVTEPPVTYDDCSYGVDHNESKRFYERSTVPYGQTCRYETRTCNDGTLSGSYTYTSCSVGDRPTDPDPDVAADVTTRSATNVDEDSATLRGSLDINDVNSGIVYFQWGTSRSNLNNTTSGQSVNGDTSFSRSITGLSDDRTYYYRAVFEGNNGIDEFGSILSFTTDEEDDRSSNNNDEEPRAITESARNIQSTSATIRGEVDMNDFRDGIVFFIFGEDASDVSDARSERSLANIDEDGDDLQTLRLSGRLNTQDEFAATVRNLDPNTRHYYTMCVEYEDDDNREDLACGSVLNFTTDRTGNGNGGGVVNPPTTVDSATVTQVATGVTTNSATLRSFVQGDGDVICYFQYGRTSAFGLRSPNQLIDTDETSSCASTRFNLQPNTTYFYRAVMVDAGETYFGLTRSFRTNSNPVVVNPRPPVTQPPVVVSRPPVVINRPVENPEVVVTVVEEVQFEGVNQVELLKFISHEDDERFSDRTDADKGDTVFHTIAIRNNGSETLRDIVVTDFIPFELELDRNERIDDDSEKQVSWRINSLRAGEEREFTTELRVRDDSSVRYGDRISSVAQASNDDFSVTSNDVILDIDERTVADEASQAASIFGAGFWPTTLVGWLAILAIGLAIAYIISRMLFARSENERVLAELRAMQNQG